MLKLGLHVLVLAIAANAAPQNRAVSQINQITQYINSITVKDISKFLQQLPIPHPLSFEGTPVSENDVIYNLYTRKNPEYPIILRRANLGHSILDPRYPVKFLVHGWLEDANRTYYRELIDAFIKRGEYNVIAVDWSVPAGSFDYTQAARNTKTTGREIGNFIVKMNKISGVPYRNVHILGHSLGAHVAGFAGKQVYKKTKTKIGRISGLDAAGPWFEIPIPVNRNGRVDRTDAEFVDMIHTDGGIFGMVTPIGDVDFYPNGGIPRQPGCRWINIGNLSTSVLIDDMFCSHYKSHEYYAESINSRGFLATNCDTYINYQNGACSGNSVAIMGEDVDQSVRGILYLETNPQRPFAKPVMQNYYQYP